MRLSHNSVYVHHAPIRVWHWVNAVGFIFLILTGIQIRFAENIQIVSLEEAIHLHNYVGFMVIHNYFLWLIYGIVSGQIRAYIPNPNHWIKRAKEQIRYYAYGIFVGDPNPHHMTPTNKFNVLQQKTYATIMFILIPAQMLSGLFLWKVQQFENIINMLGGTIIVNTIHVLLFFFFTSFIFGHIYLATLGHTPLAHIKAMFTGYEELDEPDPKTVQPVPQNS